MTCAHRARRRAVLLEPLLALLLALLAGQGVRAGAGSPPAAGIELALAAAQAASRSQQQQDSNGSVAPRPILPMGAQGLELPTDSGAARAASGSSGAAGGVPRPPWLPVMQARTTPRPACSSLQGSLDECCNCSYEEVDKFNEELFPSLTQLVAMPYFRYFKVNLYCDCPLWPDDGMCALRACSVCECSADELPKTWLQAESSSAAALPTCGKKQPPATTPSPAATVAGLKAAPFAAGAAAPPSGMEPAAAAAPPDASEDDDGQDDDDDEDDEEQACDTAECAAEYDSVVDRGVEPKVLVGLQHLKGWRGLNNPWMAEGEEDEEFLYINLIANPERYTGYKGEHAHRIWSAIYNQSCFTQAGSQQCTETRLFYRLISGMHTSISAHIAAKYLLDEEKGLWGPSPEQFRQRLGTPVARERVKNLYFAYLFVLRAVSKAAPLLSRLRYDTGMPEEDERTTRMVQSVLSQSALPASCFVPFEASKLWQGEQGAQLLGSMQATFRNITRIMDCVGCEKCKLWGKLQTLGIATALKILFSSPDCDAAAGPTAPAAGDDAGDDDVPQEPVFPGGLVLERNEVIALINLLERFATSLHYYRSMDTLVSDPASKRAVAAVDTVQ